MNRKLYESGDRLNVYLKKDVSPEMLDFINKQSDLTMFFLYAAQQLYKQIGNVDVTEILPRKYTFAMENGAKPLPVIAPETVKKSTLSIPEVQEESVVRTSEEEAKTGDSLKESQGEVEHKAWSQIEDLEDDPYA